MTRDRDGMPEAVLTPLRAAWEDTVAAGLRQASDVELLWMLDEIEAQLGERAAPWHGRPLEGDALAEAPDDIPDWDGKSPEELVALVRDLERDSFARRAEKPHARRPHGRALRCEELEPRFPPSGLAFALVA